jgi:HD-like signal output (HDOD) protein
MSAELTEEQIASVLKGISIPPQPQILVDLQMEQAMPDPDIDEIARLISKDVGISGTILRTVNSAVFGLRNKISSIGQAVRLLGVNSVVNIVNAISIRNEVSGTDKLSDDVFRMLNRFWDTATDIATASAYLAKQVGFISPDESYTLGLFHNAGIPLLMTRFENYIDVLKEGYANGDERIVDAENRHFNTNHAVLGYYVSKSWNLPVTVCDVIAQHHSASSVFSGKSRAGSDVKNMLAILKMAEHIAGFYQVIANQDADHEWEAISNTVFEYLGLTEFDFDDIQLACRDMGVGQVGLDI